MMNWLGSIFTWFQSFTLFDPRYFWIGLGAAAIPLIIHLSRSRRTKKLRFSTTRFFTDQFLRSYRMSRLKELTLLAFRMVLFFLFAMALAQPFYQPPGPAAPGGKGPRAVVLVLDNSASMGYVEDGVTLLKRAQDAAQTVLAGLGSGDTATVLLAGRRAAGPEVLVPQPTDQLDDVKAAVARVQPVALGTDLTAAIAQAETLVRVSQAPNKEVYVFSDLQDSGWEMRDDKGSPSDAADLAYFFVRVRPRKAAVNRGVTAIQYGASRPLVGVPFSFRPLLSITGEDRAAVNVRLYVDRVKVGEQRVERLQTGRWAVPRFYHTFTKGGWHGGRIEVDDKTMPLDNQRFFAVEVLDSVKLLAVDEPWSRRWKADADAGKRPEERAKPIRRQETFFLYHALTASPEGHASPFHVNPVAASGLVGANLADYPLVVLANVESLPAAAVEKLEDFVAAGGSALFFLGDKVDARFYNDTLAARNRRHGGLLPGHLVKIEGDPAGKKDIAFLSSVRYDHPALSTFQDPRFSALLGPSVTFKALWQVDAPEASVLMRASNGAPLLCEKAYGKGRVMLFTSTCNRDWTNFPIRPAFLPWTHRLTAYLAQKPLGHQAFHTTGAVVRLPQPAGASNPTLLVEKPNEKFATASRAPGEPPAYVFGDTLLPGIYKLRKVNEAGDAPRFAVNLENYESNLTYLDDVLAEQAGLATGDNRVQPIEAGLKKLLHRPLVTYVEDPERMSEALGSARHGYKLWDLCLILALLIGLFEPWLANRISARLYAKPRAAPLVARPAASHVPAARAAVEPQTVEGGAR